MSRVCVPEIVNLTLETAHVKVFLVRIDESGFILLGESPDPQLPILSNLRDEGIHEVLRFFEVFLLTELPQLLEKDKDQNLLNLRDEILGSVRKLLYLLTLE